MSDLEILQQLASALAVGLLIGLERGWRHREILEGGRVAGLRTYALISLLGGIMALLALKTHIILLGFGFLGLSLVSIAAYYHRITQQDDVGITSVIASFLAFVLGSLCVMGYTNIAAPSAVIITLLLNIKPTLHRFIQKIEQVELFATLKLLLISVVILPVLPNKTFDPWNALNPYQIWWMVVLVAAISFVGYFAVKITGTRYGALITGVFGGLASSTAVTLHLSRMAKEQPSHTNVIAAGILAACATMFPRVLIIISVFNIALFQKLMMPMLMIGFCLYIFVFIYWKLPAAHPTQVPPSSLKNPFSLSVALQFGLLLALIMFLSHGMTNLFGNSGIYLLAGASGIADVDAITLSIANMDSTTLTIQVGSYAVLIAAVMNSVVKTGISLFIGSQKLGLRIATAMFSSIVVGLLLV
ncbi:MAG: DUF4010 domain-containing protein [Gammaproteobacteria bacterium]|nr:DUF4010 domain-containing protein [Gammaproteobacteria bacterium]